MSRPSTSKVAIITGAAQGIGRRTAELLAERGYCLALIDLREPQETAAALNRAGAESLACAADITDEPAVEKFRDAVHARWGRADVLVNNAGISFIAPPKRSP